MLKLLKRLFYIENPRNKEEKVRITNLLQKPRLENIDSGEQGMGRYGAIFNELLADIECVAPDAMKRKEMIEDIDKYWQGVIIQLNQLVTSDAALDKSDIYAPGAESD